MPDVVVFAAPQLSIIEMEQLTRLVDRQNLQIPMIVCTSPQTYGDAQRMGFVNLIENAGAPYSKELVSVARGKRNWRGKWVGYVY